jgi:hypothetical protein
VTPRRKDNDPQYDRDTSLRPRPGESAADVIDRVVNAVAVKHLGAGPDGRPWLNGAPLREGSAG